ncbi:hypothetical protein KCU92_g199, partial [Aureobasidium melanogenum]
MVTIEEVSNVQDRQKKSYIVEPKRKSSQAAFKAIPLSLARPVVIRPDLAHRFPDMTNMTNFKAGENFFRQILDVFFVGIRHGESRWNRLATEQADQRNVYMDTAILHDVLGRVVCQGEFESMSFHPCQSNLDRFLEHIAKLANPPFVLLGCRRKWSLHQRLRHTLQPCCDRQSQSHAQGCAHRLPECDDWQCVASRR